MRVLLALVALEAGTTFGGMAASRHLALSALADLSAGTMISKSPSMHAKYEVTDDGLTLAAHSDAGQLIKLIRRLRAEADIKAPEIPSASP